jgi:murein DD-endopeptidase MepM/ murein hydrolase activator NlpD
LSVDRMNGKQASKRLGTGAMVFALALLTGGRSAEQESAAAPPALRCPAAVGQGQSLVLRLEAGEGAEPRATFQRRTVPMLPVEGGWVAAFGFELATSPGKYPLVVDYRSGGARRELARTITVKSRYYPLQHITMRASTARQYNRELSAKARAIINRAIRGGEPMPQWTERFIVPTTGRYSTAFGVRRIRNGRDRYRHTGVDIAGPRGRAILAANHGTVRAAGHYVLFGRAVVIDHGAGVSTLYLHMDKLDVEEGQQVRRGQLIGRMGDTGAATGPHLHWSFYVHSVPVDAMQWTRDPALALGPSKPAGGARGTAAGGE